MAKIQRRTMLRAMLGAGAGTALAALSTQTTFAAFSPPLPSRRYQKFGGHNFYPLSTLKDGLRTDWTYNDNGSVYVTGQPRQLNTRLQLPDGAVIEEVQFNYFLGAEPGMDFSLIAFDNANGYQPNIPTAHVDNVDPSSIQTVSLSGLPVRIDNSMWNYVLRWFPHAADPNHMLWGARIGYRLSEDQQ